MNTITLQTEHAALTQRAHELTTDKQAATERLQKARAALVDGTSKTSDLTSAQSEFDAISGVCETIAQKIAIKRREIETSQAADARALQLEELENGGAAFDGARTDAKEIAERITAAIGELPALWAKMSEADQLRDQLVREAKENGLEDSWCDYAEIERVVPFVSLQGEALELISDPAHRENFRQMLDTERIAAYRRTYAPPAASLPSGPYQPRVAAAV